MPALATAPTALYGFVLLLPAIAYFILQSAIIAQQGSDSLLAKAIRNDIKGKLSPILYAMAIPVAFFEQGIANGLYVLVALLWLVPDRRIERALASQHRQPRTHAD